MTVFIINDERGMVDGKLYLVRARMSRQKKCKVHVNLPLYVVMDRVCVLCHEMFSHERPNMRAECSRNCFRSEQFRRCLDVFAPPKEFDSLEEILQTASLKDSDDLKR
ncbi:crustacean CHH/MIH/GIH neurohormone family domain-containing protein [Ditylenchus destructor]|uniref:Crustacean CHH/MIH/GIH neurohormone family domain-containing protein n=1 Tax=Ditylenchus destructor TaxID=166010 RepID=A0AAD4NHD1_9BILA|nr:crustacean CHH/MIH/GIH neurohormone family domain-containing protein [Ditylenchus destructor]